MTNQEAMKQALELLAVATFHSPELQTKRTEVIEHGLQAIAEKQEHVALPLHETEEMHDAVMGVIYQGVTRTNTDALWQAYRKVLVTHPQPAQRKAEQDVVSGKMFDQFVALNEANAARVLELEEKLAKQEQSLELVEWRDVNGTGIPEPVYRLKAKQEQGEPVAWLIDDKNINYLQIKSIQRLIERARHAHMTDIKLRINGQDEWYEGDWLKHMVKATTPQQRKPLTDEQIADLWDAQIFHINDLKLAIDFVRDIEAFHGIGKEQA